MGYFPITPSTEVAELLDERKAEGEHRIVMVPADGEHGAAGICYGAALGGGRVFNATSAQGLLYALEQLPVQAGTRFPMLLDLATRTVSGPLDIRGDHSDVYFALNTGWIILLARDPQAVYDLNFCALRVGEHSDVRLPAIVAFDGFFTSHQKRRVRVLRGSRGVQDVPRPVRRDGRGARPAAPGDVRAVHERPRPDQQQVPAQPRDGGGAAGDPGGLRRVRGADRPRYDLVDLYRMDDAEVALLLLNSAAETAKDAADRLRDEGMQSRRDQPERAAAVPGRGVARRASRRARARDRRPRRLVRRRRRQRRARGQVGAQGRPGEPHGLPRRIYGLGGKDFYAEDAEAFFHLAIEAAGSGAVAAAVRLPRRRPRRSRAAAAAARAAAALAARRCPASSTCRWTSRRDG